MGPDPAESVPIDLRAGSLGLIVGALVTTALQSLVLRHHGVSPGRMLSATLPASGAGALVVYGIGLVDREIGWLLGVSIFGPVVGLAQWRVLRARLPAPAGGFSPAAARGR